MVSGIGGKIRALIQGVKTQPPGEIETTGSWLNIPPGVEVSASNNGLTILDTLRGRVFVGSEVAALMWLSAAKGLSLGQTADVLAARLDGEPGVAEQRINLFLELMEQSGLTTGKS